MAKMIRSALIALSILAGASSGHSADKDNRGMDGPGGMNTGMNDTGGGGDLDDRELLDPGSTGSIVTCDAGAVDEFGNCMFDPGTQQ